MRLDDEPPPLLLQLASRNARRAPPLGHPLQRVVPCHVRCASVPRGLGTFLLDRGTEIALLVRRRGADGGGTTCRWRRPWVEAR
jgi:hypothetical protein